MFGSITATSAAQHQALDALIAEATAEGFVTEGLLTSNPVSRTTRFVLVFDDKPDTGGEFDRVYDFDGEEVARGEASLTYMIEQATAGLGDLIAALAPVAEPEAA